MFFFAQMCPSYQLSIKVSYHCHSCQWNLNPLMDALASPPGLPWCSSHPAAFLLEQLPPCPLLVLWTFWRNFRRWCDADKDPPTSLQIILKVCYKETKPNYVMAASPSTHPRMVWTNGRTCNLSFAITELCYMFSHWCRPLLATHAEQEV